MINIKYTYLINYFVLTYLNIFGSLVDVGIFILQFVFQFVISVDNSIIYFDQILYMEI